ncbi:MAG TPA: FtsX-like permease family protein [Methylomirabilota bacterium]|nr:FtsX-like permease family protein [Methylomirabilota bacterium]
MTRTPPSLPWRLVAGLAWRETRGAWRHFIGFLACIALGVGALVAVLSVAASLDRSLGKEARALLGGDIELRSARPLDPAAEVPVRDLARRGASIVRVKELVAMARNPVRGGTLLVELKAVDAGYPLYGRLDTQPARPLDQLLAGGGVVVEQAVLERLRLAPGDPLAIGDSSFTVTGVVRKEPDRAASLFTLGPRVLLNAASLDATGLVRHGSRVRHRTLLRLPAELEPRAARAALVQAMADPAVRVATFDEAQPGLRRFFDQLTAYLRLVGVTSLLVGGIGVAAAVRAFLARKVATIAILRCLGASARTLTAVYVAQALALGALGSIAGAALGTAAQLLLGPLLQPFVPFELEARAAPSAVATGLLAGCLATLLFALWPLLSARSVPPAILLRHPVDAGNVRPRRPWATAGVVAGGLALLALWQAGPLRIGAIYLGAVAGALGLLVLAAWATRRLVGCLPRPRSLAWRQGLGALTRPGSQTVGVTVALGIGVTLLTAVALLERGLMRQLDLERRREAPSFFFVDVQPDQADAFRQTILAVPGAAPPVLVPVVRARLVAINRAPIARERWAGREDAWRVTREYVLTFAAEPPAGTVITRGRWWAAGERARAWISVEAEAARALGVDLGGTLTFDVQGVPVEAEVLSLRKVDWQTLGANFFVIFSPGPLDGAPLAYLATARVPPSADSAVQERVAAAFPNVTAIPVRDVLERVTGMLDRIALAIRLVALFVLCAGLTVMAEALAQSRAQRLYESVLLRTFGATRGVVARAFAVEYGCLGLVAGLGGSATGAVTAWVVLRFILDVPPALEAAPVAVALLASVALAVSVGFLGTYRLLGRKPLPVLRGE